MYGVSKVLVHPNDETARDKKAGRELVVIDNGDVDVDVGDGDVGDEDDGGPGGELVEELECEVIDRDLRKFTVIDGWFIAMDEKDKEYNGRGGGEDEEEDASHLADSKDGLGDPLDDSKACHDKDSCI